MQFCKASQVPGECSGKGFLESLDWVSPGQGSWYCWFSFWLLTSPPAPPYAGPMDDVLDRLCTLPGGGDLHGRLYFLVWAPRLCGPQGGAAPPPRPAPRWTSPLCPHRFPFYYEVKVAFVLWLLSPYTRGASMLYRKFVHPSLSRHEKVPQQAAGWAA